MRGGRGRGAVLVATEDRARFAMLADMIAALDFDAYVALPTDAAAVLAHARIDFAIALADVSLGAYELLLRAVRALPEPPVLSRLNVVDGPLLLDLIRAFAPRGR